MVKYLSKLGGEYAGIWSWAWAKEKNEQTSTEETNRVWTERKHNEHQASQFRRWKTHKTNKAKLIEKRVNTNSVKE